MNFFFPGIGVTPFASLLQSIVGRVRTNTSLGCLQTIDFIWVNRDYRWDPHTTNPPSSIINNFLSGVLNGFCFYWRTLRTQCLKISWGDGSPEICLNQTLQTDRYRIHLFITAGSPVHDNDAIPAVIALDRFYKVWRNKIIARWWLRFLELQTRRNHGLTSQVSVRQTELEVTSGDY